MRVFQSNSRSDNMMLSLAERPIKNVQATAEKLVGSVVYVNWPHMVEGVVESVSSRSKKYVLRRSSPCGLRGEKTSDRNSGAWDSRVSAIEEKYRNKLGICIGLTDMLLSVKKLIGRSYVVDKKGNVVLDKVYSEKPEEFAYQSVVFDQKVHEQHVEEFKTVEQLFPVGSDCFILTCDTYGRVAKVVGYDRGVKSVKVKVKVPSYDELEPNLESCGNTTTEEPYFQGKKARD